VPILGATGDEKHGPVEIQPDRRIVREGFPAGIHEKSIWKIAVGGK
jgi:hypothetical protein